MVILLVFYAVIIGVLVALIYLVAKFTITNFGAIILCSCIICGVYYLAKHLEKWQAKTPPVKNLVSKQTRKPLKPMDKRWSRAWGMGLWCIFWFYLLMTLRLYLDPGFKWSMPIVVLYYLSPHMIAFARILIKRLRKVKGKGAKWREFLHLVWAIAQSLVGLAVIVAVIATIIAVAAMIIQH